MKKILLATTAIVGAACAFNPASAQQVTTSQPFTVTIGGFLNSTMNYVSGATEPTTAKKVRFLNDGELLITAQAKADNGLVYGFRVELEVVNGEGQTVPGSSQIDEVNFFAQGGWGRVEIGNEDSFADRFFGYQPLAWTFVTGYGTYQDTSIIGRVGVIGNGQLEGLSQKVFDSSDATKISYATPVFGGFQAGISYAPEGTADSGTVARFSDTVNTAASVVGGLSSDVSGGMLLRSGYTNFIETGVTWGQTFGSFGVKLGATYNHADAKKGVGGVEYEDFSGFGIGGMFTVAGFSLGASYIYEGDSRLQKTARRFSDDAWGMNITAQYAIGPWAIGAYYAQSEMEGASTTGTTTVRGVAVNNSGNDKLVQFGGGVGYTVAPGLSVHFAVVDYEVKDEGRKATDGTVFTLATRVAF